jgi:hypothetical protein
MRSLDRVGAERDTNSVGCRFSARETCRGYKCPYAGVKIMFVWSAKDRVTFARVNAMAQKSTRAVDVPTTTAAHNAGDFIKKMPGCRTTVAALVTTAVWLVADALDRTSSGRPLFPRRLLRDCMDRRGRGGKPKDIEVLTQARGSWLCLGDSGDFRTAIG